MTAQERQDLVDSIDEQRFTPTRLREGYDMSGVDYLLDQVSAAILSGGDVHGLIAGAELATTKIREGYDMAEVDDFLADLVDQVVATTWTEAPGAGEPIPTKRPPATAAPTTPADVPSAAPSQQQGPSTHTKPKGLFGWLFGR